MQSIACRIGKHNRIVVAVSEEIIPLQAAVGAEDGIRTEEPADIGVVISGVEVVPAGFGIVVISSVSERVDLTYGRSQITGYGCDGTPDIIAILYNCFAQTIANAYYIPLYIFLEIIICIVVDKPFNTAVCAVEIIQRIIIGSGYRFGYDPVSVDGIAVISRYSVFIPIRFPVSYPIRIIAERQRLVKTIYLYAAQSVPCPVQIRCVFPVQRVSRSVIGDRRAVVVCQQIAPCAVRVTVGFAGFEFA